MCSKCSKYLENDVNDKYKLKLSKVPSDWLLNLRISFVIHLPRNSREICVRTNYNRCRNKWVKPYFCVLLSHCFSPHFSPLCRWLAVGIYRAASVKSFNWFTARWHEFREDHSQMICMVSNFLIRPLRLSELSKVIHWFLIFLYRQVLNVICELLLS